MSAGLLGTRSLRGLHCCAQPNVSRSIGFRMSQKEPPLLMLVEHFPLTTVQSGVYSGRRAALSSHIFHRHATFTPLADDHWRSVQHGDVACVGHDDYIVVLALTRASNGRFAYRRPKARCRGRRGSSGKHQRTPDLPLDDNAFGRTRSGGGQGQRVIPASRRPQSCR
jgi:hypothetical protein